MRIEIRRGSDIVIEENGAVTIGKGKDVVIDGEEVHLKDTCGVEPDSENPDSEEEEEDEEDEDEPESSDDQSPDDDNPIVPDKPSVEPADFKLVKPEWSDGEDVTTKLQALIDEAKSDAIAHHILLPKGSFKISNQIWIDADFLTIEGHSEGTEFIIQPWKAYEVKDNRPEVPGKLWPGYAFFRIETRDTHEDEQEWLGSINFHWKSGFEVEKALKGSTTIETKEKHNIKQNDIVWIGAADTSDFLKKTHVPEKYWRKQHMRTQMIRVLEVTEKAITLESALEFELPEQSDFADYPSRIMPVKTVEYVSLKNFTIKGLVSPNHKRYENEMPEQAIHSIVCKFTHATTIENLSIINSYSHALATEFTYKSIFQNLMIDGSVNKGKGGHGYVRLSKCYSGFFVGCEVKNVRHLAVQWSSSGNLIYENHLECDINLHGGWERNNMFSANTVVVPWHHRSWDDGKPSNDQWYPIWWGTGPHAGKWSGATGANNKFKDNSLFLMDKQGEKKQWVRYHQKAFNFGVDENENYRHLMLKQVPLETFSGKADEDFEGKGVYYL